MINSISINFKSAPIDVRANFAFTLDEEREFYNKLFKSTSIITQCVIISTCNRCELYFDGAHTAIKYMESFLCCYKNIDIDKFKKYFNVRTSQNAIAHILNVACGIDSMLIGEDEILRQVKESYYNSLENKSVSTEFNTIFKMAITAAKEIKTLTGLSKTPVSIGSLTANEIFKFDKEQKNVLIIGITGKIGSITAKNIISKPNINVTGTFRKHKNALLLYNPKINWCEFSKRYDYIDNADIIISATSSPHYTITKNEFLKNVKTNKKRLFIDLAVPNDIDTAIGDINMCTLFDIDYFKKLSKENNALKHKEMLSAAEYTKKWTDDIIKELYFRKIVTLIPALNSAVYDHGLEHIIYSIRKNTNKEQAESIFVWLSDYLKKDGV